MEATRIAIFFKEEETEIWDELAYTFDKMGTDEMVTMAKRIWPEKFVFDEDQRFSDHEEEIEGEIQDETVEHILTWEDGIGETMRIYKKSA